MSTVEWRKSSRSGGGGDRSAGGRGLGAHGVGHPVDPDGRLLAYAERWVPYYRQTFRELGITSRDVRSLDDFARLPVLTPDSAPEIDLIEKALRQAELVVVDLVGSHLEQALVHVRVRGDHDPVRVRRAVALVEPVPDE